MQRIIYKTEDGGIAIIIPTPEYLTTHSIEDLAAKDVPAGVEYQIVTLDDIPVDRTFRNAWEVDTLVPDGVGIGADAWFAAEQDALALAANTNQEAS